MWANDVNFQIEKLNGKVRELLANKYYELLRQMCMLDVYKNVLLISRC